MRWFYKLPLRLRSVLRKERVEQELSDELRYHLEKLIQAKVAQGMGLGEARYAALRELGAVEQIKEECRDMRRVNYVENFIQDLRYGLRMLARNPGFTAVAVLTLALGIGSNAAIYSFLDSLLLRSLPVSDPSSLVVVEWHAKSWRGDFVMHSMSGDVEEDPKRGSTSDIFPYPAFELLQRNNPVFSDLFGYCQTREARTLNLTIKGQAEVASGELVTGDYFGGLGISPAAGRLIIPDDDRTGAPAVAVLSHAFSEKYFGGASQAAGQSVLINNLPFTVVGVSPPEFFGVDPSVHPDLFLPLRTNVMLGAADPFGTRASSYLATNYYWLEMMARLRPGVSLAQAQAALAPRFGQWVATTASNDKEKANLPTLMLTEGSRGLDTLRRQFSKPLLVLMMLVGLILAIACSNVASLLLARAATRKREVAMRLSLGAGRFRVIQQLLTESILLAFGGGAAGVILAIWGIRFLNWLVAGGTGRVTVHAELNWHVLGVATALSLLTGVLFGLAPALQSTRVDLATALKETRQPRGRHAFWGASLSRILVFGQIALSLLLLVAAGLFVHTLANLERVELGFNREKVLLFRLNARQVGHKDPEIYGFYADLRERLAAIPGVRNASLAENSMIGGETQLPISLPGASPDLATRVLLVGPEFLTTMQVPRLIGRDIEERDRPGSQPVALINERFAKTNFAGQNPIGRHLVLSKGDGPVRDMEIVGVFKNACYGDPKMEIPPVIYIPYDQGWPQPSEMTYALRTTGDPLAYVNAVREVVRQADARLPVSDVRTQKVEIEDEMHQETVLADLCSAFALLALTIACVGLYGTMSYTVARRTGEIGIRMALGAERRAVVRMVLREVFVLAAVGLIISVPVALGISKFVASLLFRMKPHDPLTLTLASALLLGASLLAGYIPARRAAKVDPMVALRHE